MASSPLFSPWTPRRLAALECIRMVGLLALLGLAARAAEPLYWPDRNGPTFDSIVPASEVGRLPLEWDGESGKNVAWRTELEGVGHSTPVIGGDWIWFTAANTEGTKQWVYAVDRHSGKVELHKLLFQNPDPEPLGNPLNNYAAPSIALDKGGVYVHFGTYGTAKLDPASGDVIWQRRDINVRHYRGPGSSPVLWKNLLILTFDGIDRQFVTALNKNTGRTVWLTERTTDYGDLDENGEPTREGDLRKAYHTPAVFDVAGTPMLISVGSRSAFGYDVRNGKELWNLPHGGFNAAIRPLRFGDLAFINSGSERSQLIAIRLDDQMTGDITESHVAWTNDKRNASEACMVLNGNRLLQITRGGIASCIDAESGEKHWDDRLEGQHLPSPILAGEHLYFSNDRGQTFVAKDGAEGLEVLHTNLLNGEPISASPAVADGALFIRTKAALYCLKAQ